MPSLKFVVSLFVTGGCALCKKRIENSLMNLEGVISVRWDLESKNLCVEMIHGKLEQNEIETTIVSLGHSTELLKANEVLKKYLPISCQQHV